MVSKKVQLEFAPASKAFDLKAFNCGEKSLDDYLRFYALKNDKKQISKAFIAYNPAHPRDVIGYYTVSSAQITYNEYPESLREKIPGYPIPAMRIGKLASSLSARGQRIGAALLKDAFLRAITASDQVAIYCIIVDALNKKAASFYIKYGFVPLKEDGNTLVLPMKTVFFAAEDRASSVDR